jgi:hypothetical protein
MSKGRSDELRKILVHIFHFIDLTMIQDYSDFVHNRLEKNYN